jgi:amino acid adenylation domain-containing protein
MNISIPVSTSWQTEAPTQRYGSVTIQLPDALVQGVNAVSVQENTTPFVLLLAVLQALLARSTGQEGPAVYTTASEGQPAFLYVRADLAGDPTFRTLLQRTHRAYMDACARQSVQPAEEPQPAPGQVAFARGRCAAPGMDTPAPMLSRADLNLIVEETDDPSAARSVHWIYRTESYEQAQIEGLSGHFHTLLAGVIADPGRRLAVLPLLSRVELAQRRLWNATETDYPERLCLHHWFERQVRRTPDAIAVTFGAAHLTYREVNIRANRIAHFLRARGVHLETRVALYVRRSLHLLTGFFGILKAGGIYLPLDPAYPPARLAFMLQDAGPAVILTQESLQRQLRGTRIPVVCLDSEWATIARQRVSDPRTGVQAGTGAYMIYTSGSTGQPKGVCIQHRGISNLIQANQLFGTRVPGRVLQFFSPNFDASVFEICLALPWGATLCIASRREQLPGAALLRLLREQAITMVTLTPSLLAALPPQPLAHLTTIIAAGEASSAELVRRWSAEQRCYFNAYGPTETTVWATVARCDPGSEHSPPIGRPIANTRTYVLDRSLQAVPVGVAGELSIGGVGLARGYINQPALTAERFLPDPFSTSPGARLYRTGDLVRYRLDGSIEYLGRVDHQVKLRGFRIELGEIEAQLTCHELVRQAVVQVRENAVGEPQLVAYIVLEQQEPPPALSVFRNYLRARLPAYMVPESILVLPRLPLTPNGKTDYQALPLPAGHSAWEHPTDDLPRTAIERALARIWCRLLGQKQIGIHDNFFRLGGHSLLVARLTEQLFEAFGVELPAHLVFEHPTIAQFAQHFPPVATERGLGEEPA